jgi:N-glycosidase YbiA
MTIKFYKTNETYGFLNNFKKARMFVYHQWWNNVEAPYQAQKTNNSEEYMAIWAAKTPREARDLGQKVTLRPDWDEIKQAVMFECCMAKFLQHSDLRAKLMATGEEELVEDSPIDYYWGCGKNGTGQNMLGKTLMRVREELKGEFLIL